MSTYPIPSVVAMHPRGDRIMDVYSHLLSERIIYVGISIDSAVANVLIAQLLYLESTSPDLDIQMYVNCDGGDPSAMLAVYDTMQFVQPDVATTCVGQAVAAGAVILASGAPGKRAALPHARIVLHQPAAQGSGAIPDLILQADEVIRIRSEIESALSLHTGQTMERLRADTMRDSVFTTAAARDYGLIDHTIARR